MWIVHIHVACPHSGKRAMKKIELLQNVDLFSTLKNQELDIVARYSRYYTFRDGEVIFREGKHKQELFIIQKGEVLITKQRDNQKDVALARFIAGECFGEMDLLDNAPRTAVARTEKDTSLLIFPMKGVLFKDILQKHPRIFAQILHKLLARIAGRIRTANTLISEKAPWIQNLKKQVMKDKLTGLYNRIYLEEDFSSLLSKYDEEPTSVIMIKPDKFKDINDTYGHDAGDNALKLMAAAFKSKLRKDDIAIRFRGNEFAAVLPGTETKTAVKIAEDIQTAVNKLDFSQIVTGSKVYFTVSIGVSTYPVHAENSEKLTELAFEMMFKARNSGGNRILSAP